MPAPSFDLVAPKERDKTLDQAMHEEIALLNQRIARGEAWLAANPNHPKATTNTELYWDLVLERDRHLCILEDRRDLKCCVLQLPPGVAWQRTPGTLAFGLVRVRMRGEPEEAGEMTLGQLGELLDTVKMVKEAL